MRLINEKMCIKTRKHAREIVLCLCLVVLLDYHLFYLIPYSKLMKTAFQTNMYITLGAVATILLVYCLCFYSKCLAKYHGWLFAYIAVVYFIFVLFAVYSYFAYPMQKVADTFRIGCRFLYPAFAVPILVVFERDDGPERFFRFLNIVAFIWYVILIFQSFSYAHSGKLLFDFMSYYQSGNINTRNDAVRIGLGSFGNIMLIYNFIQVYCKRIEEKNHRIFSLIQCIMGLYCILFVQQTRAAILVDSICIALVILIYGNNIRYKLIKVLFVVAGTAFLYTSPFVAQFAATFSNADYAGSTMARQYAIAYYGKIFSSNPIFGFAWAFEGDYFSLVHGNLGYAYTSDIGFIGLLAELGIFAVPFYIWPLWHMWSTMWKSKLKSVARTDVFRLAIFAFLLVSSGTLIVTDGGRCLAFPFIIALFEYRFAHRNDTTQHSAAISYGSGKQC